MGELQCGCENPSAHQPRSVPAPTLEGPVQFPAQVLPDLNQLARLSCGWTQPHSIDTTLLMSRNGGAESRRWIELDGVRGLAALLVLYVHVLHTWVPNHPEWLFWLRNISALGWTGVHLFFVLSGFLIAGILMENRDSRNYFRVFYLRRSLRILPIYFVLLAMYAVLSSRVSIWPPDASPPEEIPAWSYLLLVQNFYMARHAVPEMDVLFVTWSVALEEQFYLFLPFCIWVLPRRYWPWFFGALVLLGPLFRANLDWPAPGMLLPGALESLGGGSWLAWAFRERKDWFRGGALLIPFGLLLVGASNMVLSVAGLGVRVSMLSFISACWIGFLWLAWLSFRFIERPLIERGRKAQYRPVRPITGMSTVPVSGA